jgi:hypothetical protein
MVAVFSCAGIMRRVDYQRQPVARMGKLKSRPLMENQMRAARGSTITDDCQCAETN